MMKNSALALKTPNVLITLLMSHAILCIYLALYNLAIWWQTTLLAELWLFSHLFEHILHHWLRVCERERESDTQVGLLFCDAIKFTLGNQVTCSHFHRSCDCSIQPNDHNKHKNVYDRQSILISGKYIKCEVAVAKVFHNEILFLYEDKIDVWMNWRFFTFFLLEENKIFYCRCHICEFQIPSIQNPFFRCRRNWIRNERLFRCQRIYCSRRSYWVVVSTRTFDVDSLSLST